ncbi:MAG: helix-hairpin-helix domain-containing protein [Mariprofundus sp.]|nr:helix-hairpin-helix domain-containing protein [Mariprofundus sp.]
MKLRQMLLSLFVAMFMAGGLAWAGDVVNINSATAKELQKVDGIGAKTAARIVVYRDEHGAFKSVDELLKVKGIGKKKLEKAGDELTVSDEGKDKESDKH